MIEIKNEDLLKLAETGLWTPLFNRTSLQVMARELLEHRRQTDVRAHELADVGHSHRVTHEAMAITQVANMLAELFKLRDETNFISQTPNGPVHGSLAATSCVSAALERIKELEAREAALPAQLQNALTDLGWRPPQ